MMMLGNKILMRKPGVSENPYPPGVTFIQSMTCGTSNVFGLMWSADGLWLHYSNGSGQLYRHILTTAWDVSTIGGAVLVGGGANTQRSLNFNSDGSQYYSSEISGLSEVRSQTLSVPYSMLHRTTPDGYFSVEAQEPTHTDMFFKPDGTKLYVLGTKDNIYQYSMSTPDDINTASYDSIFYATGLVNPQSFQFTPDGLKLFLLDDANDLIKMYNLGTAWDLSTISALISSYDYSAQCTSLARELRFGEDGRHLYLGESVGADQIHEYTLNPAYTI